MGRLLAVFSLFLAGTAFSADEPSALVLRRNAPLEIPKIARTDAKGDQTWNAGDLRLVGTGHSIGYEIQNLQLIGDELVANRVELRYAFSRIEAQVNLPDLAFRHGRIESTPRWRPAPGRPALVNQVAIITNRALKPEDLPRLRLPGDTAFELSADGTTRRPQLRFTRPAELSTALRDGVQGRFTDEWLGKVLDFNIDTVPETLRGFVRGQIIDANRPALYRTVREALTEEAGKTATLRTLEQELAKQLPPLDLEGRRIPGRLALGRGAAEYSSLALGDAYPKDLERNGDSLIVAANGTALRLAAASAWPELRSTPANDREKAEWAQVLSAFHGARIDARDVAVVSFAAPEGAAPAFAFIGNAGARRLEVRARLVVRSAIETDAPIYIPVSATFAIADGQLRCDRLDGRAPNPERVGAIDRLQNGLRLGLFRMVTNQTLSTAQRERRLQVSVSEVGTDPHLVVRVR